MKLHQLVSFIRTLLGSFHGLQPLPVHTACLASDGCCWCKDSRHCQALGPNSVPAGTSKFGILENHRMTRITAPLAQSSVTISTTASLSPNQSEKPLKHPVPLSQFQVVSLPEPCPRELLLKTNVHQEPQGAGHQPGTELHHKAVSA